MSRPVSDWDGSKWKDSKSISVNPDCHDRVTSLIVRNFRFVDHFKYLSTWIETMDLPKKLNFVIHDWGSGLGFHWCNLNRERVQSITFMEAVVGPIPTWKHFPEQTRAFFQAMRSEQGERT